MNYHKTDGSNYYVKHNTFLNITIRDSSENGKVLGTRTMFYTVGAIKISLTNPNSPYLNIS
jgi:hypothetical protein